MLKVQTNDQLAGSLFRAESELGKYIFAYAEECSPQSAVSLTMPVIKDQYTYSNKLHPIFDMNLPEGALLDRLRKDFSKVIPKFDDLTLLEIIGQFQIGRLRFIQPGKNLDVMPALNINELLTNDGAEGLFESLLKRFSIYSGISGAQPKVMIRDENSNGKELDRITYRGATHIVKAWNVNEYPELAANEYFCMRAAFHAKLEVPNFELSQNRKFLIIKRFDIDQDAYLGFEDFCVLNGKTSEQKYEGSYENICKRIKSFISPDYVKEALESFFKLLVLSCIVKNGDAHLKNFGVVYRDSESIVKLSPAYDIISTVTYQKNDILALTLAGSKRWPNVKTISIFARAHCDLSEIITQKLIDEVIAGVQIAISELTDYIKKNQEFSKVGNTMLEIWRAGLRVFG